MNKILDIVDLQGVHKALALPGLSVLHQRVEGEEAPRLRGTVPQQREATLKLVPDGERHCPIRNLSEADNNNELMRYRMKLIMPN